MVIVNSSQSWPLRPATDGDRAGSVALLARSLPFDIVDGPFRTVDAEALTTACWEPADSLGVSAGSADSPGSVIRLVSDIGAGVLPGPDGVAVEVPAGIAVGSVGPGRPGAGTAVGYLHLLAVHPEQRGQGLGRSLLGGLEAALVAAGATELTTLARPPRFGWPAADPRYTAFGLLLESAGWSPGEVHRNMTVDLDTASRDGLLDTAVAVAELAGLGVEVRQATTADAAALGVAAAAFGGTWRVEAALALGNDPDLAGVQVAVRDDRVVGFACHGSSRPGWFGPVGVDPGERLGGIGAVLLRRCLVDIRAQGRASAQICWVGPVPFYARTVGAYLDRTFVVHSRSW
jgi:mycothiol synthase